MVRHIYDPKGYTKARARPARCSRALQWLKRLLSRQEAIGALGGAAAAVGSANDRAHGLERQPGRAQALPLLAPRQYIGLLGVTGGDRPPGLARRDASVVLGNELVPLADQLLIPLREPVEALPQLGLPRVEYPLSG
jgi:hypothetical protein